jgi:hypothetical protein
VIVLRAASSRLIALILGLLVCLAGPGTAVTHAIAHVHVADEHEGDEHGRDHAPSPIPMAEDGHHGHSHGHATVDCAPTYRQSSALDVAVCNAPPLPLLLTAALVEFVNDPASPGLLPRPGPERGPPLGSRAPPQA